MNARRAPWNGVPVMNDTWLAAQCRHLGATLVSRNPREFARVRGLKTEDWGTP
jgi:predicted nucleic acid-binding protein